MTDKYRSSTLFSNFNPRENNRWQIRTLVAVNYLKSIAAGSGAVVAGKSLPESWRKLIVNSVLLPTHANTSDDIDSGGPEITTTAAPTEYTVVLVNQLNGTAS